jgi:beta-galactosidase
MKDRPWLWCEFLWVMFDFAADQRKEGDHPGRNDKGLVTADRKVKKDAFYFYQANWTDTPVLHINSRRFDPRPPGHVPVKVYSNCEKIELFVNGRSLGSRSGEDCVFVWTNVVLDEGEADVRAVGEKNGKPYADRVTWKISPDAPTTRAAASNQRGG